MVAEDIGLLADIVRACAVLEKVVRKLTAFSNLNDTDVWVLILFAGLLERSPAAISEAKSAAWVSSKLGFARERVSMSVKGLIKLGFLRLVPTVAEQDGRTRSYLPTDVGLLLANELREVLAVVESNVRVVGQIAKNARAVDPQVVAECLRVVLDRKDVELTGLDRRRLAQIGKKQARKSR